MKTIKEEKIEIKVIPIDNWKSCKVKITTQDNLEFQYLMCACEYLMNVVATDSNAGYDNALELLCKGAKTYKNLH